MKKSIIVSLVVMVVGITVNAAALEVNNSERSICKTVIEILCEMPAENTPVDFLLGQRFTKKHIILTIGYFLTNIQEDSQEKYQIRKLESFSDEDIPAINGTLRDISVIEKMKTIIRDIDWAYTGEPNQQNKILLKTRKEMDDLLQETVKYYQAQILPKTALMYANWGLHTPSSNLNRLKDMRLDE